MTKEWYREIGYKKNPLHIEPRFKDKLFGYDALIDELFYRIDSGNMVFLEGRDGKTAVLIKIIEKYKGKGRIAYINCRDNENEFDMKKVVKTGRKVMVKGADKIGKELIILLDNVSTLSKKNAEWMKYYFDQGDVLSIIMTGRSFATTNIPPSLKHRIGKRVYGLKKLTEDEAVDLLAERLEFNDIIKEEDMLAIISKSNGIKDLFRNCEAVIKHMIENNMDQIDEKTINQIVGVKEDGLVQ
jgi:predicted AAA+ superfamily ATPase